MDRLTELNKIAENLTGTTVFKKNVWIVMDKARKMIAKGAPHQTRYLVLVDDVKDRKRVLIYNSEGAARNAMVSSTFAVESGVPQYLRMTYGGDSALINCLEVVKAVTIVKI